MELPKWRKIVQTAIKKGDFEYEDKILSESWHTCAVGEWMVIKGINSHTVKPIGDIITKTAELLGMQFNYHVRHKEPQLALKMLQRIEKLKIVVKKTYLEKSS